jgi:hypothetical protein
MLSLIESYVRTTEWGAACGIGCLRRLPRDDFHQHAFGIVDILELAVDLRTMPSTGARSINSSDGERDSPTNFVGFRNARGPASGASVRSRSL